MKLLIICVLILLCISCVKTHTEIVSIGVAERVEYIPSGGFLGSPSITRIYGTEGTTRLYGHHTVDFIGDSVWVIKQVIDVPPNTAFQKGESWSETLKIKTADGYKYRRIM